MNRGRWKKEDGISIEEYNRRWVSLADTFGRVPKVGESIKVFTKGLQALTGWLREQYAKEIRENLPEWYRSGDFEILDIFNMPGGGAGSGYKGIRHVILLTMTEDGAIHFSVIAENYLKPFVFYETIHVDVEEKVEDSIPQIPSEIYSDFVSIMESLKTKNYGKLKKYIPPFYLKEILERKDTLDDIFRDLEFDDYTLLSFFPETDRLNRNEVSYNFLVLVRKKRADNSKDDIRVVYEKLELRLECNNYGQETVKRMLTRTLLGIPDHLFKEFMRKEYRQSTEKPEALVAHDLLNKGIYDFAILDKSDDIDRKLQNVRRFLWGNPDHDKMISIENQLRAAGVIDFFYGNQQRPEFRFYEAYASFDIAINLGLKESQFNYLLARAGPQWKIASAWQE